MKYEFLKGLKGLRVKNSEIKRGKSMSVQNLDEKKGNIGKIES